MSGEHTPGPWHYQEGTDAYTHIVRTATNDFICRLAQDGSGVAEANARLIAAAPETATERDRLCAEVERLKGKLEHRKAFAQFDEVQIENLRRRITEMETPAIPPDFEKKLNAAGNAAFAALRAEKAELENTIDKADEHTAMLMGEIDRLKAEHSAAVLTHIDANTGLLHTCEKISTEKAELVGVLKIARQWMPNPAETTDYDGCANDIALVEAVLAKAAATEGGK